MKLNVHLIGKIHRDRNIFFWNLVFRQVTEPGSLTLMPGNSWDVRINRVTRDIVFDRKGLYIRTNINTIATDIESMDDNEKTVVTIFYTLLRDYPEDQYVTVSGEFEVRDNICQYLLYSAFTINPDLLNLSRR